MYALVQSGHYGVIKKDYTTINGFYVIKLISWSYTMQNNIQIDGHIVYAGKLVVNAQYLYNMQENTNWYWKQQPLQQTIIVPTHTIIHPNIDVITIIYVHRIPKNLCIRNQAKKSIQIHPIIMTDADYDYILDEIKRHERIEFERNVSVISDDE